MAARKNTSTTLKRSKRKNITTGIAHIHSSHQNTIVTFTDLKGNVIS